ncbi:MAG: hypothetical protein AABM33_11740 [Pseudomonadota bacterium]
MSQIRRMQFLIASGALLAILTVSQGIAKCGPDSTTAKSTVPLSSLSITTPVFMFERSGRFLRGNLASGEWTQISNHGFNYAPTIVSSADGRWISYSGEVKTRNSKQYWLYDKRTGSDRLYHQHPTWGGGIPEFSPDSKWIALFAEYDTRWPSPSGAGLYLISVETLASSFLENPSAVAIPKNQAIRFVTWSKDGSEMLLTMRAFPPGVEQTREHFAYRMAEKRYERISGEYDQRGEKFFRGGSRIAVHEPPTIQSRVRYREIASPDGRWTASIDRAYELTVSAKEAASKKVSVGRYDDCSGVTIGINGWLDARHMVYSVESESYVFDAVTGRKADLFRGPNQPAAFTW